MLAKKKKRFYEEVIIIRVPWCIYMFQANSKFVALNSIKHMHTFIKRGTQIYNTRSACTCSETFGLSFFSMYVHTLK